MHNAINELENGTETALKDIEAVILKRINQLIVRVRGDLPQGLRTKIITIITVDVHGRDVV
jgi:dynein heavy chain